jgi:prolyl 4-hydroxylase
MDEYIYCKDNIFSDELLDQIIRYFEHSEKKYKGTIGTNNNINEDIKKCTECIIPPDLMKIIINGIDNIVSDYINNFILSNNNLAYTHFKIKKYIKNSDYFKKHCDISSIINCSRQLAIIIYLNNVDEGGETILYKMNTDVILMKIKPKKGRILIFPTNFCFNHSGEIPLSNDKYIINGFLSYIK